MAKTVVPFGDQIVVLEFGDFPDNIDVDELTKINYSNLYGEIVTVSALLNRMGILKAEAEAFYALTNLDCEIYASSLAKGYRREANINSNKFSIRDGDMVCMVKLTEDAILNATLLDPVYQNKRKAVINAKKNLSNVDSLYWAIQSKDKKLSVMMKSVTPKEFFNDLLEGVINGIMITKPEDNWTKNQ